MVFALIDCNSKINSNSYYPIKFNLKICVCWWFNSISGRYALVNYYREVKFRLEVIQIRRVFSISERLANLSVAEHKVGS